MSSMRSASSSTRKRTRSRSMIPSAKSFSRPGVPTSRWGCPVLHQLRLFGSAARRRRTWSSSRRPFEVLRLLLDLLRQLARRRHDDRRRRDGTIWYLRPGRRRRASWRASWRPTWRLKPMSCPISLRGNVAPCHPTAATVPGSASASSLLRKELHTLWQLLLAADRVGAHDALMSSPASSNPSSRPARVIPCSS